MKKTQFFFLSDSKISSEGRHVHNSPEECDKIYNGRMKSALGAGRKEPKSHHYSLHYFLSLNDHNFIVIFRYSNRIMKYAK